MPRRPTGPYRYPEHPTHQAAPKPLSGRDRPDGWITVTWALPGLERAAVAVPEHHAADGGGPALGHALAAVTTEIALQDGRHQRRLPFDACEGARAPESEGTHG